MLIVDSGPTAEEAFNRLAVQAAEVAEKLTGALAAVIGVDPLTRAGD